MTFDEAHRRIKAGDLSELSSALSSGLDANLTNLFGWTLLMLAAMEGNTSIGQHLISRGSKIDSVNDFGETALSLAAQRGHLAFVNLPLSCGASADVRPHGSDLADWIRSTSGLSRQKVDEVLTVLSATAGRPDGGA